MTTGLFGAGVSASAGCDGSGQCYTTLQTSGALSGSYARRPDALCNAVVIVYLSCDLRDCAEVDTAIYSAENY